MANAFNSRIPVIGGKFAGWYWEADTEGGADWFDPSGQSASSVAVEILEKYEIVDHDGLVYLPKPVE